MLLFLEQTLNGVQFGVMLFLMGAGLTLVFGIMNLINLAHGSFYMLGAYVSVAVAHQTGSFLLGILAAIAAAGAVGMAVERGIFRHLYRREHLLQVLATFGLILFFNELVAILWGPQAIFVALPGWLSGTLDIGGLRYPSIRLAIIATGLAVALGLGLLITRSRIGMLIRAGATNREMLGTLGVNVAALYMLVFALGAGLAGLAGAMAGPILAVRVGMGEDILILTFVVIIIGGLGSVKGSLLAALLVGLVDTYGRAFAPTLLRTVLSPSFADSVGASLSEISIYLLMALVLLWRPRGLFAAHV